MLQIAAEYGNESVVLELLRKGANTDIPSKEVELKETTLYVMCVIKIYYVTEGGHSSHCCC